MSNDYYVHSGYDIPLGSRARSAQVDAIGEALEDGFDLLPDKADIYDGKVTYGTCTGSANAYVLTTSKGVTALSAGVTVSFTPNHANTGAATINVDTLGVKDIKQADGNALETGELVTTQPVVIVYNGTNWRLIAGDPKTTKAYIDAAAAAGGAPGAIDFQDLGIGVAAATQIVQVNAAGTALEGTAAPVVTTQAAADDTTKAASTAFVHDAIALDLLTGVTTTQSVADDSTKLASTAFVHDVVAAGVGADTGLVHLATVTAAAAAEVEFTQFSAAYDVYVLSAEYKHSSTTALLLTFKIGGSYITANYDSVYNKAVIGTPTFAGAASAAGSAIQVVSEGQDAGLLAEIFNTLSATKPTLITYQTVAGSAGLCTHTVGVGQQDDTGVVEALKLAPNAGTVTGTFRLYGRTKVND